MYCLTHAQKYASKPNCTDFSIPRPVYIDMDSEASGERGRKKTKFVDAREPKFKLGSVSIESMGVLVGPSDTEQVRFFVSLLFCAAFHLKESQDLPVRNQNLDYDK